MLKKLESAYEWIDKINPKLKTILIIILIIFACHTSYRYSAQSLLKEFQKEQADDKKDAEKYTISIASDLNGYVESILKQDNEATNVVLLNYHNSLTSTNGLSYRYLTALTEKKRGFDTKSCIRVWKELEYINYEDELRKINRNGYLEIDSIPDVYNNFPKMAELLEYSGAKSAGIYPIIGVNGPIGLIVVIYHTHKYHPSDYYTATISPYIQPIGSLLDYNEVKKKVNN